MQNMNILEWVKSHAMLAGIVVIGLIAAVFFLKKAPQSGSSSTTSGGQADLSGLSKDANGNPIVYRDTADTFINVSKVIGSYNTNPNPTQPTASAPPPPPTTPASPVEHPIEATIRTRFNATTTQVYDQNNPGGVPLHSTPGGTTVAQAPYGSLIQLAGPAVIGPSNFSRSGSSTGQNLGSTTWFQTSTGQYVSAYDLTGLSGG